MQVSKGYRIRNRNEVTTKEEVSIDASKEFQAIQTEISSWQTEISTWQVLAAKNTRFLKKLIHYNNTQIRMLHIKLICNVMYNKFYM